MKSALAQINSIYKPKRKRKSAWKVHKNSQDHSKPENHLNTSINKLQNRMSPIQEDPSLRSISVLKPREEQLSLRNETKSVEPPRLPSINTRSPEPFTPKHNKTLFSTASSFDSDFQKLELLVNRNNSARHNLLTVQQQIMELGVKQIMKEKFQSIEEDPENYVKIEENLPHHGYENRGMHFIGTRKELLPVRRAFKLPPIC